MSVVDGSCPKCNIRSLVIDRYEYPDGVHIIGIGQCNNCGKDVTETYKLVKQEVSR